jgi:anti-anti-sigma regulatory factor
MPTTPRIPAPDSDLRVDIRSDGTATVIALGGRLGSSPLSAENRDRVMAVVKSGEQLVLDFGDVEESSGVGLRHLLLLARHIRGLGGTISARGTSDHLRAIAEASGFHDLFLRAVPVPTFAASQVARARTDFYPTHSYGGFALRPGAPFPLRAAAVTQGVNFAVYFRHATRCTLVLFEPGAEAPFAEIPFPPEFRIGDAHAMTVFHLDPEKFEDGYRMEGPFALREGHRFDRKRVLLDPAARAITWRRAWGCEDGHLATPRGRMIAEDFDWEDDQALGLPLQDLVVYEMHVREFTRHATSGVRFPGTHAGMRVEYANPHEAGQALCSISEEALRDDRAFPFTV